MRKISITDITLKKLSQDRAVSLLFREKTAIASCADTLGVNAVELSPVKSVREDTIIYKTISRNVKNSTVAIPVGFSEEEAENAWECVKEASFPRLQVELPISTVQMEYIYHVKADKMLSKIAALTKKASELCSDVEFSALDATRADEDFLIQAVKEAEANGAKLVTICDDAGTSLPEEIADIVKKVKEAVTIPVYVQLSDSIDMAVACAVSAVKTGADGLKCSMAGKEALSMGAFAGVIKARGAEIGIESGLDNTKIYASIDEMLSKINHETYETADVSEKKKIVLDSDSTLSDVAHAANVLGYDLSDEDTGKVYKALSHVCEKKGSVGAKELEALIASFAMQAPSTYHVESYTTNCSNLTGSMSQVTLRCGDEILNGVSTGDGPIDSVFRAIEQSIGFHYELDDFQIHAVTDGKEALGNAIVRLRSGGKLYSGNGISTDIVAASIRAYINALNKIVFEEE